MLKDKLAQKLGHFLMLLDKDRRLVLFLLQPDPNFVIGDWKRLFEYTESPSGKVYSFNAAYAAKVEGAVLRKPITASYP